MLFDAVELRRIEAAKLIALGVPPSELDVMTEQQRQDVLDIAAAEAEFAAKTTGRIRIG